ncbi:MAG: heme-copper oxidase subunit III [Thermoanaerobaculia bacterium]|nr:heme-copper oxidase subunit III [Thermoanaerobaculia bacterium]
MIGGSVVVARFPGAEESRRTSFVGMVMALASWTMLFVALFFSYAVLRLNAATWPPDGLAPLPKALPFLNTVVLLASSVTLHRGARPESEKRPGALRRALVGTMALGSLFLALQLAVWIPLWQRGFRIDNTGSYGSIFYGLTVFHALHVLAGLVALAVLLPGAFAGRLVSGRSSAVRLPAMFWHFVDAVWAVMFVAVYLL